MIFKVCALLLLQMCLAAEAGGQAEDLDCSKAKADIILLLDGSVGVGAENYARKLSLAMKLVSEFSVSPTKIQVGAIVATSLPIKAFDLNTYADSDSVKRALEVIPYLPGERETGLALDLAFKDGFTTCHGVRPNVSHILVAFLDGPSTDSIAAQAAAKRLRDSGVVTVFVGVDNVNHDSLVALAGDEGNVIETCSYGEIGNEIRLRLTQEICEATVKSTLPPGAKLAPPTTTPVAKCLTGDDKQCQHICTETASGFTCSCNEGYSVNKEDPTKCDIIPCTTNAIGDIILVVDSSDSIGEENYKRGSNFLSHVVQSLPVGPDAVRFGCLVFSWDVIDSFRLNTHTTKEQIVKSLSEIPYLRSATLTFKAFSDILSKNLFSTENGGRDNVPDIVILMTDGKSGNKDLTIRFATELKKKGCKIITVGVSKAIDKKELLAVASDPSMVFYAAGYEVLDTIEKQLATTTCAVASKP
jgi:hypothetical protein